MKPECTQEMLADAENTIENNALQADALRTLAESELMLVGGGGGDVVFG